MSSLLLAILPPFILYVFTIARTTGFFNASSLFAYAQLAMAIGTLPLLDPNMAADQMHAFLIVTTFILFLVVTSVLAVATAQRYELRFTASVSVAPSTRGMWVLIAISIAVCVVYFNALGYNVLTKSLSELMSGTGEDLAALRLNAYSGSSYLFPGYVNQFRNVLLPALTVVVSLALFQKRHRWRFVVTIALALASLIFLLGTGQRGAFVTFAIVMVVFLYYRDRVKFRKAAPLVAIIAVPLFMLSTVALGRAQTELAAASGPVDQFMVLFNQIVFRAFGSNQDASVVGFRFVFGLPTQNGLEWLRGIVGLVPGVPGSDLSNQIYAQMFGTTRGTAPLSLWGSAYYNFGVVGTLLLACIIAALLHALTLRAARLEHANSLELMGMAGVFTVLGSWVVDGPTYLFNVGLVVFIFMWIWGGRIPRAESNTQLRRPFLTRQQRG